MPKDEDFFDPEEM